MGVPPHLILAPFSPCTSPKEIAFLWWWIVPWKPVVQTCKLHTYRSSPYFAPPLTVTQDISICKWKKPQTFDSFPAPETSFFCLPPFGKWHNRAPSCFSQKCLSVLQSSFPLIPHTAHPALPPPEQILNPFSFAGLHCRHPLRASLALWPLIPHCPQLLPHVSQGSSSLPSFWNIS